MSVPEIDFRRLYDRFDENVTAFDCGAHCAAFNPGDIPVCCDICQAVPAAYQQEWEYLHRNTDLWHAWRGDECPDDATDPSELFAGTPEHMLLLACKGVSFCQRQFRAISCRQFPFFPYITSDYRFLGLAYEWVFEETCWVISHLEAVRDAYREEFVRTYDELFNLWLNDLESYAIHSQEMRAHFAAQKRRIPILHRNGGFYLLSPRSERLYRVQAQELRRFGVYKGN